MSFSNKLMLKDWNWRQPITEKLGLNQNKFGDKKLVLKEKVLRDTQIRSMHEMGEMKRVQELRVDVSLSAKNKRKS